MAVEDIKSQAADLVKKVLTAGIGAVFLTEESLRHLVSQFNLPKEFLAGILESAGRTKNEFLSGLTREVMSKIQDKLDPQAVLQELVQKNKIEIKMEINLIPKND